jgi:hypothetical protein
MRELELTDEEDASPSTNHNPIEDEEDEMEDDK